MLPDATAWTAARIEQLAAGLSLGLRPSQAHLLLAFLRLLHRWNATYNLTAVRDPAEMLVQHLADCLAVVRPLERHLAPATSARLLDVGSGGGLPGVVIAIALPDIDVTCIDAVGKKAAFIRQVAAELRLPNLHAEHARVEDLRAPPFDLITSRAFASLVDFTRLTRRHLAPGASWSAMKGRIPNDEISALPADVTVFHVEPLVVPELNAERCLIWMKPSP